MPAPLDKPNNIYNCDETIIDLNKATQKVVVRKSVKRAHSKQVSLTEHVTIQCCGNYGSGTTSYDYFQEPFPGGHYSLCGPVDAMYAKQKFGFMDSGNILKIC